MSSTTSNILLRISNAVALKSNEVEIMAVRAQGPGGQHVNKSSTAIHLRFDIQNSSLPEIYKTRLLQLKDYRITADGIIIIKAQKFRSQEKNKLDALERLHALILKAMIERKKRKHIKPSKTAIAKRIENKKRTSKIKQLRKKSHLNLD